jgi:hypothetical protein
VFDVFNIEIETLIKDGLSHLYWFKADLHKAWLVSGVPPSIVGNIKKLLSVDGKNLSKREQMDALYERLRDGDYNRRLEVSRNFARILIEQNDFVAKDSGHQVHRAQLASFKLKELHSKQNKEQERKQTFREKTAQPLEDSYDVQLGKLRDRFFAAHTMAPQAKGYELEKIFTQLMLLSGLTVVEPFRIVGEQFDGAIKYEGRFYLIELKWTAGKSDPSQIGHFFYKISGKMDGRGVFISMAGFSDGVTSTLPHGKELTMMLLDGIHLTSVLTGQYTFQQLLDHAIKCIALKGSIYCSHDLK